MCRRLGICRPLGCVDHLAVTRSLTTSLTPNLTTSDTFHISKINHQTLAIACMITGTRWHFSTEESAQSKCQTCCQRSQLRRRHFWEKEFPVKFPSENFKMWSRERFWHPKTNISTKKVCPLFYTHRNFCSPFDQFGQFLSCINIRRPRHFPFSANGGRRRIWRHLAIRKVANF